MAKAGDLKIEIDTTNKTNFAKVRADHDLLILSLAVMTKALDDLISDCRKEGGPQPGDIAKARGYLPKGHDNTYPTKE